MAKRKNASARKSPATTTTSAVNIPEDEAWRLINETGVLQGLKRPSEVVKEAQAQARRAAEVEGYDSDEERSPRPRVQLIDSDDEDGADGDEEEEDEPLSMMEKIFETSFMAVPLSFLYAVMDMLCRIQYAQHPTFLEEVRRTGGVVPVLFILIYLSNEYKSQRRVQALFFLISIGAALRLVWIVNRMGMNTVIRQSPPLSVIWIYLIIQLDLTPSVISLGILWGCIKFLGLKIVFD